MKIIYQNNSVSIELERIDQYEYNVKCNGHNFIVISAEDVEKFTQELNDLLDQFRI